MATVERADSRNRPAEVDGVEVVESRDWRWLNKSYCRRRAGVAVPVVAIEDNRSSAAAEGAGSPHDARSFLFRVPCSQAASLMGRGCVGKRVPILRIVMLLWTRAKCYKRTNKLSCRLTLRKHRSEGSAKRPVPGTRQRA